MRAIGGVPLALALFLALPHPVASQNGRPLSPDHWSYSLREALHALGVPGTTLPMIRGNAMAAQLMEFPAAPGGVEGNDVPGNDAVLRHFLDMWSIRLGEEGGREGESHYGEFTLGWADDPTLPIPSDEAFLSVLFAKEFSWGGTLWAEPVLASGTEEATLWSGGFSFPVADFDLFLGRVPMALGQGQDPFILSGYKGVDGAFLTSREPFHFPGFLRGLGPSQLHLGLSPFISTSTVQQAWWGSFGLALSPHPSVDLGFFRTVRFAGEGLDGWSFSNVVGMLAVRNENNAFDDSGGELALRVRWDLLGQPLSSYLSLAFEDKATVYEDPGLLVGVLVPFLRPEALFTLRYEFQAFGSRARWCDSCSREFHSWYRHPAFGDYLLDGIPLGAMLGGYGASHRGRLDMWFSARPVRGWAEYQHLSREGSNLLILLDKAPARVEAWGVGAEWFLGYTPLSWARLTASGALRSVVLQEGREFALSASLTIHPGN
jgi:hypothetical protein